MSEESQEVKRGRGRPSKQASFEASTDIRPVDNPVGDSGMNLQVVETDSVVEYTRPQTDSPEMGTTARLFGNMYPSEITTITKDEISQTVEKKDEVEQEQKISKDESTSQESGVEILTSDDLKGKKFKAIIDGKEIIVNAEDLIKGYQTDQYLTQKGQRIAEERKKWAEEKRQLEEMMARARRRSYYDREDEPYGDYSVPIGVMNHIEELERKIKELEAKNSAILEHYKLQEYEFNRKKLREELGQDADTYIPRIQQYIAGLDNPDLIAFYDTIEGAKSLYYKFKYEDLQRELEKQKNQASQKVEKPPIVKLGSSSNISNPTFNESEYLEALKKARQTNHPDDWNRVLKIKGVI